MFVSVSVSVNFHFKAREDGKMVLRLGLKKLQGLGVDGTGSGSCPVADFCKSNVELSASVTAVIIMYCR